LNLFFFLQGGDPILPIAKYKKRGAAQKRCQSADLVEHIHAIAFSCLFLIMDSIINRKSTGSIK